MNDVSRFASPVSRADGSPASGNGQRATGLPLSATGNGQRATDLPLLEIKNLDIQFGSGDTATHAVRGVSLEVRKGEMLALVGESGSGKSLTALSILKLLPPEAAVGGEVRFEGENILKKTEAAAARLRGNRIGMIFQEPMTALNPLHPIRRQIVESYKWHHKGEPAQAKIHELFEAVGLTHLESRGRIYPHELSGGERQRVMIGMAIANDPDLLIADEPTTALDVTLQRQIMQLLKDLQHQRGMGIVLITHDLSVVRKIADHVAVMQNGAIVETGTVREIFENPQHPYTQMLIAATPTGAAPPIGEGAEEILRTPGLSVHFPVKSAVLRRTVSVVKAVENVRVRLQQGETIGIVGESGSGKSSLGFALLKLIQSQGPIVFLGQDISGFTGRQMRPLRDQMQLVFQDPYSSLNPRMTVGGIIAEGLKLHHPELSRAEVRRQVREILAKVGLTEEMIQRYPHEFSGGQRQRIAIARAMVLKPKFVVLDEPTSALDMSVQGKVIDLLRDLQRDYGVSYLFISHDLRVIRALARYVIVLKRGEVIEEGEAQELFARPKHEYTQALMHAAFGEKL